MNSFDTHLLVATVEDPSSPTSWSGTPFNMVNALREVFGRVSVLRTADTVKTSFNVGMRLWRGQERRPLWITEPSLRRCAERLHEAVQSLRPDIVLSISSQHLIYAGPLGCPTYMVSDAPWMAYKEAYAAYEPSPDLAAHYARAEAAAARQLTGVIYPTPWACAQAQVHYGVAESRVHCVPFGANRQSHLPTEVLTQRLPAKPSQPLRLLFVGKDWERKGGALALRVLARLAEMDCTATLTIVGCSPAIPSDLRDRVTVLGYLSPASDQDRAHLEMAYLQADVFLLPSRAECFGLVFAEAQSWALPCVALGVHGVPGVVVDGRTGRLCPADASAEELADAVLSITADHGRYVQYASAALTQARELMTWPAFANTLLQVMMHRHPTTI